MGLENLSYQSLSSDDGVDTILEPQENMRRRNQLNHKFIIVHLILLSTSAVFLLLSLLRFKRPYENYSPVWNPPVLPLLDTAPVKFAGSFEQPSPYRGPPSKEVDDAWAVWTGSRYLSVSEEDIQRSKKTSDIPWFNATVPLPNSGGQYIATLEIFHQLHCLNKLRMATHGDAYEAGEPPEIHRIHLDHCIEILRLVLMCHGDTGLITANWVIDHPRPYPDFNTWHQCRDPQKILQFAIDHQVPPELLPLRKTPDSIERPTEP